MNLRQMLLKIESLPPADLDALRSARGTHAFRELRMRVWEEHVEALPSWENFKRGLDIVLAKAVQP